ncbi:Cytochrome b-c1 complex subunit 2, mitochondrial [Pseudolycoriella hygida]|uniref:Cytochrome b-c1 complex subunit 2, mitochondrial n=1 Tax=Pseudolycoriella hygida TaxID=35572 RepID=A0A9Q0S563_9DIPT|nr:Cytochrome b-c1 complex subunit 2, mitochondrial [Pseudolycoriella hygida]
MACTAHKTPLLRTVAVRGYAAQAGAKIASKKNLEVETTTLPNKLVVASVESNSPISRISILFRAGSRNETYDNLGATHLIRSTAGISTSKSTGFLLTRSIQQVGGNISVTSDREIIEYNVELMRDKLDTGLKFLSDVACHTIFKPWDINDNLYRVKEDLARVTPQVRAVDLLHRAAFRNGLGNSIFCAKHHVGKLSPETLQHYLASNYKTSRAAVVGVGVDHQLLVGYAKNLALDSASGTDVASKYYGGELRVDKAGNWAHVAVGTQSAGWANPKEALAFALLQQVAGTGPVTKRGNSGGALGKVVGSALGDKSFGITALNASYSDDGLFGFVLSAEGGDVGKAIDAAIKALKQGSVSNADVTRAKEQLKAVYLSAYDTDSAIISDMGIQAVLAGKVASPSEVIALLDSITSSDVNAAAKKVASGKWSVGAVGYLANVPYIDQL